MVTIEPLKRADKQKRSEDQNLLPRQHVAAIDFGTTFVSLAYATHGYDKVNTFKLNSTFERVPNAILLKKVDGSKCVVEDFGFKAQDSYCKVRPSQLPNYIYFERIKMLLERDESVDRTTTIKSFGGNDYFLVEVIAFILKHLKDLLLGRLSDGVRQMKSTHFDWVITVPAIWKARAKRMMREAAYMAGLTSDKEGLTRFTPIGRGLPKPPEDNPEKLTLALEPEVAALYAQNYTKNVVSVSPPKRYMVVDIGGGTVDVTVQDYNEAANKVSVVLTPTGNAWGGTTVNKAFSELLEDIVGDREFDGFIRHKAVNAAILNKFLYNEFEEEKKKFGNTYKARAIASDELTVNLPSPIVEYYGDKIERRIEQMEGIEYEDDTLYIKYGVVETRLFQPTIDGIVQCTVASLEELKSRVDTIYLVGGFGGCQYIYKKLEESIRKYNGRNYCNIVCPEHAHLAIATGAVMWRKNPSIIQSRKSDATYGIEVSIPFKEDKHDVHYRTFIDDRGYYCDHVFSVFLQKGELAQNDEVYTTFVAPRFKKDTSMTLTIYTTPELGVQYTEDRQGKMNVRKIGELNINIPNPENLPVSERRVDIFMDFSGTEIQAKAKYRVTGEEVKTVCDFLSNQEI